MNFNFCVLLDKAKRVDMYLSTLFSDFSRSYIQKMIDRGQVILNWNEIRKNIKVKKWDEISLKVITESLDVEPEKINLDIIYEDSELIVINKDYWVNVHPVPWEWGKKGTLVNAILYHCKDKLPSIGWISRPWIVHRLDKDTSWVIMVAKTDSMMNYLANIIKNRKIDKYYLAVVDWIITDKEFKIESFIGRDPNSRIKMTTKNPINPKIALSIWEVLKYIDDKYTLIKIKIETGRTHQIRVHMASIWHPILGDKVYGNLKTNKELLLKYWLKRQALHAYKLVLNLYWKRVEFMWSLKEDMKFVDFVELL